MVSVSANKQKSRSQPWKAQQPYLKDIYSRARGLADQPNYEYGPDRVAGFDPASTQAFGMAEQRAMGNPVTAGAEAELSRTMGGEYLNPESNPWLQRFSDIGARNMRRNYYGNVNALGSSMEASGRSGGGAHGIRSTINEENLATGLGDFEAQLWGGAYEGERGRMMGALGMSGQVNEMGWRDISALRAVGQDREQQRQREVDDMVARFQHVQYGSAEKLAEFSQMIGQTVMESKGSGGGTSVGILS